MACALSGCNTGILDPKGPVGAAERTILLNSTVIMLAIVIPTIIATLAFAWWYRASNTRARFRPDFVYSGQVELIVWSIPTLVILFLGGVIWIGSYELDPGKPLSQDKHLEVQVVSLDWKWLFIYPEQGVASVNQLVIPAGQPVHFSITSASVMNVFFVPELGSMIYAMNRMATNLNLQADHPGEFHGMSAMFSGDGFPDMQFKVRAVSDGDFQNWVRTAQAAGQALDRTAYTQLAKQSRNVAPTTFRGVEPHLFDAIVRQDIPPAPGPETERGGADVSPRPGG
ncbi:ubiquinol oxidase subunit II [Alsobacter soli]|uniref:Ubiquinol oxidase subunit 2 n=1 Tax=Alsobacter soli TaxID=2109933 RepID=A0A2T1HXC9_9HYPH|nr:ubiquinol oxidase subunit II [Alsobacter soli]PSC06265.1 ubiquinol oxidase subunit II [Alsobacter soli]